MNLLLIPRVAFRAIVQNAMRSALTALGIIIGVAAVICVVAIGEGASARIEQAITNIGANMIWIEAGGANRGGVRTGSHGTKSLTVDDMKAIQREVPGVALVAPGSGASAQVVYENTNWGTRVTGTEPAFFDIRSWAFSSGGSFSQDEVDREENVAVLGETVRRNLFGNGNPVGQTIRIGTLPFKVVGVLAAKGAQGMGGDLRAEPDLVGGLICTDGGGTAKESADRDPDEGNAHPANRPRSSMRSAHRSILIILSPDRDPPRTHL